MFKRCKPISAVRELPRQGETFIDTHEFLRNLPQPYRFLFSLLACVEYVAYGWIGDATGKRDNVYS